MVAFGTSFYGFCGLLLSYLFARKYVESSYALLATLGIWAGEFTARIHVFQSVLVARSLGIHGARCFCGIGIARSPNRTLGQWILLGVISGLLVDVYFVNGVFLLIPLIESILGYREGPALKDGAAFLRQFGVQLLHFSMIFLVLLLPTLITRKIIFGGMFRFGAYSAIGMELACPFLAFRSFFF